MEITIGILTGAVFGFAYWRLIGCSNSTCSITNNKFGSMIIGALLGLMILTSGCGGTTEQDNTNSAKQISQPALQEDHRLSNETFAQKMKEENTVLLDVRTSEEFNGGHIPSAQNINVNGQDFAQQISALDKSKTYLIYCKSGARSEKAYNLMSGAGFENLYTLPTGIVGWNGEIQK